MRVIPEQDIWHMLTSGEYNLEGQYLLYTPLGYSGVMCVKEVEALEGRVNVHASPLGLPDVIYTMNITPQTKHLFYLFNKCHSLGGHKTPCCYSYFKEDGNLGLGNEVKMADTGHNSSFTIQQLERKGLLDGYYILNPLSRFLMEHVLEKEDTVVYGTNLIARPSVKHTRVLRTVGVRLGRTFDPHVDFGRFIAIPKNSIVKGTTFMFNDVLVTIKHIIGNAQLVCSDAKDNAYVVPVEMASKEVFLFKNLMGE